MRLFSPRFQSIAAPLALFGMVGSGLVGCGSGNAPIASTEKPASASQPSPPPHPDTAPSTNAETSPPSLPPVDPARKAVIELGPSHLCAVVWRGAECEGCDCVDVFRTEATDSGRQRLRDWLRSTGRVDPSSAQIVQPAGQTPDAGSLAQLRKDLGILSTEAPRAMIADQPAGSLVQAKPILDQALSDDRKEPTDGLVLGITGRRAIVGFYKEALEGSFTSFVVPLDDVFDAAASAPSLDEAVAKSVIALEKLRSQIATWNRRNGEVRERPYVYLVGDAAVGFAEHSSLTSHSSHNAAAALTPESLRQVPASAAALPSDQRQQAAVFAALAKVLNLAAASRSVQIPCHGDAALLVQFLRSP